VNSLPNSAKSSPHLSELRDVKNNDQQHMNSKDCHVTSYQQKVSPRESAKSSPNLSELKIVTSQNKSVRDSTISPRASQKRSAIKLSSDSGSGFIEKEEGASDEKQHQHTDDDLLDKVDSENSWKTLSDSSDLSEKSGHILDKRSSNVPQSSSNNSQEKVTKVIKMEDDAKTCVVIKNDSSSNNKLTDVRPVESKKSQQRRFSSVSSVSSVSSQEGLDDDSIESEFLLSSMKCSTGKEVSSAITTTSLGLTEDDVSERVEADATQDFDLIEGGEANFDDDLKKVARIRFRILPKVLNQTARLLQQNRRAVH